MTNHSMQMKIINTKTIYRTKKKKTKIKILRSSIRKRTEEVNNKKNQKQKKYSTTKRNDQITKQKLNIFALFNIKNIDITKKKEKENRSCCCCLFFLLYFF